MKKGITPDIGHSSFWRRILFNGHLTMKIWNKADAFVSVRQTYRKPNKVRLAEPMKGNQHRLLKKKSEHLQKRKFVIIFFRLFHCAPNTEPNLIANENDQDK